MKDGFIKVAAAGVSVTVADVKSNAAAIKARMEQADTMGLNLVVFPELCVTSYSCGDLFYSNTLQRAALAALEDLTAFSAGKYPVYVVGLPVRYRGKLYNCAAVLLDGQCLGIVPKTHLPNGGEFYEKRQFSSANELPSDAAVAVNGQPVPMGSDLVFAHEILDHYTFGVEICEDMWAPEPPCGRLCKNGAVIVANLSASDEVIGKADYRRTLISATTGRFACGYIYCAAGPEESTQDMVFSRHNLIAENGAILAENEPFGTREFTISEIDVDRLANERHMNTTIPADGDDCCVIEFSQPVQETQLTRYPPKNPFVPADADELSARAESILQIQSYGLAKRMRHAWAKTAVIGISGGLDSTLAILVAVRAMKLLDRPLTDVVAVTMPCFGTTARTKSNAVKLCELLGVTLREVDITKSVLQHFQDIGHGADVLDVTYENAQARERTQVLMDIANQTSGIVVGTGDLSELALGWATYNGDHMSMYGVNASVPKTLVRYIVRHEAQTADKPLADVLFDILDTPVSPELLPADKNGEMSQKTEDLVGPYELHDFFLYHMLRTGAGPGKIFRLCKYAYGGAYDDKTILHWLRTFVRRFFVQQFKRSCLPDGPKVGTVTLSPRGDWRMPSDASSRIWLDEIDALEQQ
ncbi:MAG: NAD(+) synthase [Oscillospiraceae bacterium]|jgi:NAD+ synthase (glutamine-hydrolysing)|nr:NAD(+) synthase [Oscillospiraceae bacterium]